MTTGFQESGSDDLDTKFEPYTAPFAFGSATSLVSGAQDLSKRYLSIAALASFQTYTLATDPDGPTQGYETLGTDIYTLFPAKNSVNYTITVPVTTNQVNLNLKTFVTNYLKANFPAYFDTNFSFFNNNFNANGSFSDGNPSIIVQINSGVVVYSNDAGTPALTTGSWPSGVFITLINKGHIVGALGAAGTNSSPLVAGGNGGSGGVALNLSNRLSVTNSAGFIYGGGGGGGSGGPAACDYTEESVSHTSFITGGTGGTGAGANLVSATSGRIGGKMDTDTRTCTNTAAANASWGGDGGDFGQDGESGFNTGTTTNYLPEGDGGPAGNAVSKNGLTLIFNSGGTSPHVLGSIV